MSLDQATYDHVEDLTTRLALTTHDPRYSIGAFDNTLRCYITDLEADLLDDETITVRGDIVRALSHNSDRSSPQFWSRLDAYWSA